jgi:hypothetical protein
MTRRIVGIVVIGLLVTAARAAAIDLKVTDSRGTEVVVTGASVDYSGMLSSDKETAGLRVLQGDGEVTVKWADVDVIRVVRTDTTVKPPRIEVEVTLRNGKKIPAALARLGSMKLVGKSELGDYAISLDKVRAIAPVR